MKKIVIVAVVLAASLVGITACSKSETDQNAAAPGAGGQGRQGGAPGQFPGGGQGRGQGRGGFPGGGGFGRQPMTVNIATAKRASIAQQVTVVGNLVGEATVSVAPRTAGRLQNITVKMGDRVARGQRLASIEDFEIREQVKQAEAAQEVSQATIRQREADLKRSETNVQRSRSLFERQLLPRQTLDDNEATYQASVAQLELAKAQAAQSKARLDELKITLANTIIVSPVDGFVARRAVDPGAFVSQNAPVVDVVDISSVRLVANVVEKDLRLLKTGDATRVQVDAFPGETFTGRIARVSPILDPSTRTASIEIEIPNSSYRLKPGMYARVGITIDAQKEALVVPANAVVDLGGRRGVFTPMPDNTAVFRTVQVGLEQGDVVEVASGLEENDRIITTGAGALRDGDRIIPSDGSGGQNTDAGPGQARRGNGGGRRAGGAPASE